MMINFMCKLLYKNLYILQPCYIRSCCSLKHPFCGSQHYIDGSISPLSMNVRYGSFPDIREPLLMAKSSRPGDARKDWLDLMLHSPTKAK